MMTRSADALVSYNEFLRSLRHDKVVKMKNFTLEMGSHGFGFDPDNTSGAAASYFRRRAVFTGIRLAEQKYV